MANYYYNPSEDNSFMANYHPYQITFPCFNHYQLQGFEPAGPSSNAIIGQTQQFLSGVVVMNHQAAPPPPPPQERVAVIQDAAEFSRNLPPGYRFRPTDEELVMEYLRKKACKQLLPMDIIPVVELYRQGPQELTANYPFAGDEEAWYFFTTLDRKYLNGSRPSRAAGEGFWKPTGVDKVICSGGCQVGFKKTLDYYFGQHKQGNNRKTCWKMHEYRTKKTNQPPAKNSITNNMKIDGIVLCRIYYKKAKGKKSDENGDHPTASVDATSQRSEETVEEPSPPPPYNGVPASNAPPPNNSPSNTNGVCSSGTGGALSSFNQQNYGGRFMNEHVSFGSTILPLRSRPPPPAGPMGHRFTTPGGTNHHANRPLVNQVKEYSRPPAETQNNVPPEQAASSEFRPAQPDGSVHNNGDQDSSFSCSQNFDSDGLVNWLCDNGPRGET